MEEKKMKIPPRGKGPRLPQKPQVKVVKPAFILPKGKPVEEYSEGTAATVISSDLSHILIELESEFFFKERIPGEDQRSWNESPSFVEKDGFRYTRTRRLPISHDRNETYTELRAGDDIFINLYFYEYPNGERLISARQGMEVEVANVYR